MENVFISFQHSFLLILSEILQHIFTFLLPVSGIPPSRLLKLVLDIQIYQHLWQGKRPEAGLKTEMLTDFNYFFRKRYEMFCYNVSKFISVHEKISSAKWQINECVIKVWTIDWMFCCNRHRADKVNVYSRSGYITYCTG